MDIVFAVTADFASMSDGKLNILGIFQEVNTQALPHVIPQMSVAYVLSLSPSDVGQERRFRMDFLDSKQERVTPPIEGGILVPPDAVFEDRKAVHVGQFVNFLAVFQNAGESTITVSIEGEQRAVLSVYVHEPPPSPGPSASVQS